MTTQRRTLLTIICAIAMLANIVGVGAQEKSQKFNREVVTTQNGVVTGGEPMQFAFSEQGDNTFVFVSSEMSIDGKVVKGAPYSAQAVTEIVQTLADGNRIVRRTTASVYRDGEGRTRREQTLHALGGYSASGDAPQTVFINDPVGQVNYILDAKSHTARKVDLPSVSMVRKKVPEGAANSEQHQKAMAEMKAHMAQADAAKAQEIANPEQHHKAIAEMKIHMAQAEAGVVAGGPGAVSFERTFTTKLDAKDSKKESLGKQTIEGIEAEGTRYSTTIAAGVVGNELPISIVSETWYSSELQTVVMSKHSDPRVGENTYRLTNINRSEPAHSLFELPSDYTVKETVGPNMRYKIESEVRRPGSEK
jgi:hypothetical protein